MSAPLGSGFEALLDELTERFVAKLVSRLAAEREPGDPRPHSPWMAIETAAAYLDWPKQRLYKLSASGVIPHYKQEGRLLFRRDELDDWLRRFAEGSR